MVGAKESLTELQDLYEAEDALSLCDLSTNTSDASDNWDDEDQSSSNSDQDFFEFFSQDFTTAENVIFCGKLISLKPNYNPQSKNTKKHHEKKSLFRWKSDCCTKSKSRWNLFMFGIVRFPTPEMEMRDMRMRKSRRRKIPASTVVAPAVNGGEMVMKNQSKGKGFWGILRDLGSKSQHAKCQNFIRMHSIVNEPI